MNMTFDQDLEDAVTLALSAVGDLSHSDQVKVLGVAMVKLTAVDGNNHFIAFSDERYVYKVGIERALRVFPC
jgi:hypothetical protein